MPHFLIHELLNREELEQLESFAREPGRTIEEIGGWLQDHGHQVSKSSVGRWKQQFDQTCIAERMSGAGGLAKAFMDAAKDGGGLQIADAAMLQIGQMIFEAGARLSAGGDVKVEDLNHLALSMQRLMLAKAREEKTRTEMQTREREAVDKASKLADAGGDAKSVVATIKQALGITQQA